MFLVLYFPPFSHTYRHVSSFYICYKKIYDFLLLFLLFPTFLRSAITAHNFEGFPSTRKFSFDKKKKKIIYDVFICVELKIKFPRIMS